MSVPRINVPYIPAISVVPRYENCPPFVLAIVTVTDVAPDVCVAQQLRLGLTRRVDQFLPRRDHASTDSASVAGSNTGTSAASASDGNSRCASGPNGAVSIAARRGPRHPPAACWTRTRSAPSRPRAAPPPSSAASSAPSAGWPRIAPASPRFRRGTPLPVRTRASGPA